MRPLVEIGESTVSDTIYRGIATSTGDGRAGGRALTNDGLLDITLAIPKEMGGPGGATNPEQLFAAGWGSGFPSAPQAVAAQRKTRVTASAVVAEVQVHATPEGGFTLAAALHVELSGVDQATADEL